MKSEKHGIVAQVVGALIGVTTTMFGIVPAQPQLRQRDDGDDRKVVLVPEDVQRIISANAPAYRNKKT